MSFKKEISILSHMEKSTGKAIFTKLLVLISFLNDVDTYTTYFRIKNQFWKI